ncbi:MAG: thioredoxin domain-containing protein, partial [Myxococcales bacterium]|nr:thioredoxin domain-containing protein [Myxococcales bacterium]
MHRIKLSILLAASLGFVAPLAGCGGQRGAPHDEKAEGGPGGPASAAKVLTMADVDDSFSDKIKGERFQITYDSTDPFHGAEEPLVTIVEFSDFQCPYCQKFTDNLKELLDDPAYKDDVRVVFKQFPLDMHKDARAAAEAALAAGAQGKFWEMHDILFNPKNRSKMSRADLEGYAADLGLDVGAFTKALDSGAFKAKVDADLEQGKKFGVRGTPSFVINGKFQRGAPRTIEGLKQLVDAEKKDAEELIKAGIPRGELYARMMKAAKDSRTPPPQQPRQQAGAPDPNANYAVPTEGRPSWGKPDALVTIVEFSDFQ